MVQEDAMLSNYDAKAVADGVNVDFEVYKIRTRISEQGHQTVSRMRSIGT
jgi:type I site-specific restriction endonuclease